VALGFGTATVGALGGIGGAVLLVPALVLTGTDVADAAPLGLVSVAAGSLAAAAPQLEEGVVHHRLGVTLEVAATTGALAGALAGDAVGERTLTIVLGVTAVLAAVAGGARRGMRNRPVPAFAADRLGEWPGTFGGAYRSPEGVVPYRAERLGLGLAAMGLSGVLAGMAGISGGFVKTPAMSEIMRVPVKVAAATTTFTVGITSAAALLVFAVQGRVDAREAAAVALGALAGGRVGARLQLRLPAPAVRRVLSGLLVAVGVALVVTA
jgi:uncharacterized membrane protein YfcA